MEKENALINNNIYDESKDKDNEMSIMNSIENFDDFSSIKFDDSFLMNISIDDEFELYSEINENETSISNFFKNETSSIGYEIDNHNDVIKIENDDDVIFIKEIAKSTDPDILFIDQIGIETEQKMWEELWKLHEELEGFINQKDFDELKLNK